MGVSLGGLDVREFGGSVLPLGENVQVTDAAPVTIRDNPNLCQCQVDAFEAELRSTGWTGTVVSSENGDDDSCAATCARTPASCP